MLFGVRLLEIVTAPCGFVSVEVVAVDAVVVAVAAVSGRGRRRDVVNASALESSHLRLRPALHVLQLPLVERTHLRQLFLQLGHAILKRTAYAEAASDKRIHQQQSVGFITVAVDVLAFGGGRQT